jgi:thiol-disulfide isomerase/thioredoxin
MMASMSRRHLLTAAGTLAAGFSTRKSHAQELEDLAGALKLTDPPVAAPAFGFVAADGSEHHLADFLGHAMVVNLWATWCAPCVAEMPSLAALSKALAPNDIAVLPLSSDRGGAAAVQAFYKQHGITGLPVLLDPQGAAAHACKVRGIPTSLIIDRQGRERARLEGAADWSTPAAAALVRKLA